MSFLLNLDAEEFIPEAGRVHHHSRERDMGSRRNGEAGHSVSAYARHEGWDCRRWMGRLLSVNGNQGAFRAAKRGVTFVIEKKKKKKM